MRTPKTTKNAINDILFIPYLTRNALNPYGFMIFLTRNALNPYGFMIFWQGYAVNGYNFGFLPSGKIPDGHKVEHLLSQAGIKSILQVFLDTCFRRYDINERYNMIRFIPRAGSQLMLR